MIVTLHIFLGCFLAGLALRAGEMIAGAWAMRLAMRKALKAHNTLCDQLQAEERQRYDAHKEERVRLVGKSRAN